MSRLNAKILCVDGDPAIRELLASHLPRFGFQPYLASSGGDALRLIEAQPVDICVLGSRMPDLNAETLAGELRRRAPKTRLVLSSGDGIVPEEVLKLVDRFVAQDSWFERSLVSELISLMDERGRAA